ncbi:MAG: DUF362 domain-containing protein [Firmicutes bacterium]|nr:DUF362 domain-containing protein [Bacillota bacterium]
METTSYKVAIRTCPAYDPSAVEEAVVTLLADLGGAGTFIAPGKTVLFKPNILAGEEPSRAVTTHPEVVRAAIRTLSPPGGRALVGDSPGVGSCRKAAEKAGIAAVARELGAELAEFAEVAWTSPVDGRRFPVAREIITADLVVNLPKLKTHRVMVLSGAVKNLFGCLVGLRKAGYHLECQGTDSFARMLLALAAAVAPGLTIVDAIVAMDGPGPRQGRARPGGVLVAGRDPLAVDFVLAELVGFPAESVPHLRLAQAMGLAAADPHRREIVGEDPGRVRIADFLPPPRLRANEFAAPSGLRRFLARRLLGHPRINHRCRNCGICATGCPAGAILPGRGRATVAVKKCINCYCCDEMCPYGAVEIVRGFR